MASAVGERSRCEVSPYAKGRDGFLRSDLNGMCFGEQGSKGCGNETFFLRNYVYHQWPLGLRRESAATRLMGLRVRIPPGAWMSVSCECCVLSGIGLCYGPITRPEESGVSECDCGASITKRPWPTRGCCAIEKKN